MKKNESNLNRTRLLVFESGQQVIIEDSPAMALTIECSDDPLVQDKQFNVSKENLEVLKSKVKTHKIMFDTINENISIIAKDKPKDVMQEPEMIKTEKEIK